MGCGMSMVKYILFLFNLLCAIAGILIVIFSGAIIAETSETYNIKDAESSVVLGICLLILGAAITIVAFFGCCGAIRESICMSITYMILLGILLILQIIFILVIALGKDNFVESMKIIVNEGFKNRNEHPELINGIQTSMKCCGVEGPTDYHAFANTGFYPDSCCDPDYKQKDSNFKCSSLHVYKKGCSDDFQQHCTDILNAMLWSSVAVAAIELAGILSACCLIVNIRNNKRRSAY
ncbi:23 kDa integral membrane protein-like isoform X1 [Condylostylus longicornis]|uniref:23 kDa integral membrane protein-like isoform X1 n=1 Tax=Condylostylus longicornis TaxID=2530218 RepID=UPI00244DFAFA|nr:23 kDa integral membrane protein-like isoform X1 [Condylostylus longicornis]XP_055379364.1 23 kDa integral membrane protein-like isoform X1 [Condylostylus longicornis]